MSEIKPKRRHWTFQMQQNAQILQRPHFHHFCHVVANKLEQCTSVLLSDLISLKIVTSHANVKSRLFCFFRRLDFLGKAGQSQRSDAWNRFLPGPGATFLPQESRGAVRCEPRAVPDTGLFMSLSPHRVPDRSHPCQHQSHGREFPLMETLVTAVYSRAVITLCLPHRRTSFEKSRDEQRRGISAPFVKRVLLLRWLFRYGPHHSWQLSLDECCFDRGTNSDTAEERRFIAGAWQAFIFLTWHANFTWYLNFSKKDFLHISLFLIKKKICTLKWRRLTKTNTRQIQLCALQQRDHLTPRDHLTLANTCRNYHEEVSQSTADQEKMYVLLCTHSSLVKNSETTSCKAMISFLRAAITQYSYKQPIEGKKIFPLFHALY